MNMARIATKVAMTTGAEVEVVGFDTVVGLPPPADYRDHHEYCGAGDYPPIDRDRQSRSPPDHCRLVYGDVAETGRSVHGRHGRCSRICFAYALHILDHRQGSQRILKSDR
jgi:hypothetical protein